MEFQFSSIYMFLFLLSSLQHLSLSTSDIIRQSCENGAKNDPNLSYNFCVTTLEANPKSESATSLEELAVIAIELTASNATEVHSYISKLLKQRQETLDPYAKNCLRDCLRFYSDAISSLRDAKEEFQSKSYERANLAISSAVDAPSSCEGGFSDKRGEISPLTWENKVFFQWTVISIAFTNMFAHE